MWQQITEGQQAFSGLLAWSARRFITSPGGEVRFAEGLFVSGDYFGVLGVEAVLGRVLNAPDDVRGCGPNAAVISYAYWQREFGGDPGVLSKTVLLDGYRFPIVGVTPPTFFGTEVGRRYDVAVPVCADDVFSAGQGRMDRADTWWLAAMGRLKPGWTIDRATENLIAISPALIEDTLPKTYGPRDAQHFRTFRFAAFAAANGVSNLRNNFQEPLIVLLVTAALVLVVACANLANLLLARASARGREMAVRLAIGASRARIVRQLLVESAVIAAAGAVLGSLLARVMSGVLVGVLAGDNPAVFVDLSWNWRMLGFTSGVAFAACLLFGVAPALRATALTPGAVLKAAGRGLTASRERFGLRRALVAVQVAVSLVLLLSALLFSRTLYNLLTADAGFDHRGLVAVLISHLSRAGVSERDAHEVRRALRERLAALPDIASVAQADVIPLGSSGFWNENVRVEGITTAEASISNFNRVSAGFFRVLGIRLKAGRDFNDGDSLHAQGVAIVSEAFVRRFVPDAAPLGKIVRVAVAPGEPEPAYEIVGVVEDTKLQTLRDTIEPMVYVASAQEADAGNLTQFLVRPRGTVAATLPAITREIAAFSPAVNVEFRILNNSLRDSLLRERLMASLSGAFGVLAAVLAAMGLYGVMSYTVARRANEIGIRMAMGAGRRDVMRMILAETGWLLAIGVACGTALALGAARFARTLLFGLEPTDATTIAIAIALLGTIGLVAGFVPARRASRVDPAIALRDE